MTNERRAPQAMVTTMTTTTTGIAAYEANKRCKWCGISESLHLTGCTEGDRRLPLYQCPACGGLHQREATS